MDDWSQNINITLLTFKFCSFNFGFIFFHVHHDVDIRCKMSLALHCQCCWPINPSWHIRVRSPALWIGSYETRRLLGQAHAKLAVSRSTRSKLALISWATQPDSQHNCSARTPLLETRKALGYTWRWRVTTSYEECTASLLREMWVYYEFKRVQHELQRVSKIFEHVQKLWTCSRLQAELCQVMPSRAELLRVVPSYMKSSTRVIASASFRQLTTTRHNSPLKLG